MSDDTSKQAIAKLAVVLFWLENRDGCGFQIRERFRRDIWDTWERSDDAEGIRTAFVEARKLLDWLESGEGL